MAQWMTLAGLQQSAMSSPFAQFEGHADLSRSTVVGTLRLGSLLCWRGSEPFPDCSNCPIAQDDAVSVSSYQRLS